MAKLTQFESGAVCAAKVCFEQGEETLAFEILAQCVTDHRTRRIADFDVADHDLVERYRMNADMKDSALAAYHGTSCGICLGTRKR